MLKYLILFLFASAVSFLLTPLVRFIAKGLGAFDLPGDRKVHVHPIPRLGGFAIFICFYIVFLISFHLDFFHFPHNFLEVLNFGWLIVASFIVLGLGAVDDFYRIPPALNLFSRSLLG